jgi:hypothetical protein
LGSSISVLRPTHAQPPVPAVIMQHVVWFAFWPRFLVNAQYVLRLKAVGRLCLSAVLAMRSCSAGGAMHCGRLAILWAVTQCWLFACILSCMCVRCSCPWEHSSSCRRLYSQAAIWQTYFLSLGVVGWPCGLACACNVLAKHLNRLCQPSLHDKPVRCAAAYLESLFRGATRRAHCFSRDGLHCFQPARAGRSAMVMQHSASTSMTLHQAGAPSA